MLVSNRFGSVGVNGSNESMRLFKGMACQQAIADHCSVVWAYDVN